MIIDTLAQAGLYHSLGPRFITGLNWIAAFEPAMPDGRYEIDGDDIFALVQSYDTAPRSEKTYESHRVYADIQYVAAGTEVIYYAPITTLVTAAAYDAKKDFLLYSDASNDTPLHLSAGSFAIFYPQDGHKPSCIYGASCRMKKVVIKVRL